MARIFSAIDIEDDKTLEQLVNLQETVDLGFNRIKTQKMHITLEFFNDINEKEIEKVKKALCNIEQRPFKATVKGVGAFPSEDYIRVVWAGLDSPQIFQVKRQASTHGVSSSGRNSFTPHITFLRVNDLSGKKKRKLKKNIDRNRETKIAEMDVNKVKLFESVMTGNGTEYKELEVKHL